MTKTDTKQPAIQDDISAFRAELTELCRRYSIAIVPYTKTYPNGQQVPAVEYIRVPGENGQ